MMLNKLRNSHTFKVVVVFITVNLLTQIVFPTAAFALGGGPGQSEFQSFEPVGTSEMVNLSSGDFVYNIPLLDVDGYPINLSYHSGVSADQESSWVGLGWNVNPGVLNRNMRGLPDDFNGDEITKEINIEEHFQFGVFMQPGVEVFGLGGSPFGMGIFYDNYKGLGFEFSAGIGFDAPLGLALTGNLGVNANSQEGIDISADVGLSASISYENVSLGVGVNVGTNYSSRGGITSINVGTSAGLSYGQQSTQSSASLGIGRSSYIPVGTQSYVPVISVPKTGTALSFQFTGGGEIYGVHLSSTVRGWSSTQELVSNSLSSPAYGYLYAQEGDDNYFALQDFNREKDGVFHTSMHNLPLANHTYDLYAANGQGIGGMYRPYRSEVGTVSDPLIYESSSDVAVSAEVGGGQLVHVGVNTNSASFLNVSGPWIGGNDSYDDLTYRKKSEAIGNEELYEPAYFKKAGEFTTRDDDYFTAIGGNNPMRLDLEQDETTITGKNTMNGSVSTSGQVRGKRVQRNQNLSYLTAQEASDFALEISINNYVENDFSYSANGYTNNPEARIQPNKPNHHMSEVTVLREDGARYVYGIPAYNLKQKNVTFSMNEADGYSDCSEGLVTYDPSMNDNNIGNGNAIENYFEATTTPDYAHSYLLTGIISPDYVDITGDGPTDDDLGNYTKFNYSKIDNYKWRVPYQVNQAIYDRRFNSDDMDNKASYIYGEKEMWYLHSVETKNYVAEFQMSDRRDAVGTINEDGGLPSTGNRLNKLDKITLFAKRDKIENPSTSSNPAVPIKVVHFEYDYTLCQGIPNNIAGTDSDNPTNEGGKLTLKKVFFTYGNSDKGELNPYVFHYADSDHDLNMEAALNPNYSLKGYDRWGTYKEQTSICTDLSNDQFPYTRQDATTDTYAGAWLLSTMELPSGGVLSVDYESDEYAYVQNKRAQQMFFVDGATDDLSNAFGNELFTDDTTPNNYIRVVLPDPINGALTASAAQSEFITNYIGSENTSKIYFKFFVNMTESPDIYDYVPGYADLDQSSIVLDKSSGSTDYDYAYLKFKPEYMKDDNSGDATSPVSKAAFQMVRNYLNRVLYPGSNPGAPTFSTFTSAISNFLTDAKTMKSGVNSAVRSKGVGKKFIPNKSWVRLQNPTGNKKGGGVRVSQIKMNDSWNSMVSSETSSEYGQTYEYDLEDGMSSGVASYEPLVGGDENPFRKPVPYEIDRKFYDNSTMFQEEPYGETIFPSGNVVYSKVIVKNIAQIDVNRNATGRTEYEFYTAKDFPIITNTTGMEPKKIKPSFLNNLFSKKHTYIFAASQGYSIELNDMHGKPKAKRSYAEGGVAPIEGIEYRYKSTGNRLDNRVDVISKDNTITEMVIGEEVDVVMDSRRQKTTTSMTNVQTGFDMFLVAVYLIPIPSFFIMESETHREFKSAVSTKVIQKYGILDEVVVYDQNSKVSTKNLLFDEATGKVLMTETINEFDAPLYAFNYPAHWAYKGMEQASENIDAQINIVTDGTGLITLSTPNNLVPGDELISGTSKIWILKDETAAGVELYAIDEAGTVIANLNNVPYKVVRSGKRNLHSLSVGDIVSRSPLINVAGTSITPNSVLNANAIEYSDKWGMDIYNPDVKIEGEACNYDYDKLADLQLFLNELLVINPANSIEYILQEGYQPNSIAGITTNNLLFDVSDFNDLSACRSYIYNPTGTSSGLYLVFEDLSTSITNPFPNCQHESALIIQLSIEEPAFSFQNIQSFSNITGNGTIGFNIEAIMTNGSIKTITGSIGSDVNNRIIGTNCEGFDERNCPSSSLGDMVNPYVKGIRGNFKANKSYAYNADRNQLASSDIRVDGEINIVPFWGYNTTTTEWHTIQNPSHPQFNGATNGKPWVSNSVVTKSNPLGNQLESKDALGRYSAAQYGYNNTISIAEVFNSKYTNFGFDGFEDYNYYKDPCGNGGHFKWTKGNVSDKDAHTGRYSFKVMSNQTASNTRPILFDGCVASDNNAPYVLSCEDDNGLFEPEAGKKYVLSAWTKEQNVAPEILVYQNVNLTVSSISAGIVNTLDVKKSNIIDGWQKVEITFEISSAAVAGDELSIKIINNGSGIVYMDDIRIQPFNSTMNSYVYDPVSLRLWAELDDRNYATFYEYDEEGTLVRVKKETARGIKTIQENRAGVKK